MFNGWERADFLALAGIVVPMLVGVGSMFGAALKIGWRAVKHLGAIESLLEHVKDRVDDLHDWKTSHANEHKAMHATLSDHAERLDEHGRRLDEHGKLISVLHGELHN